MMKKGLENSVRAVIEGQNTSLLARGVLRGCSYLYAGGVLFRHLAYKTRLLRSQKVPALVISVGNISAGGTGKTPFVRLLAEALIPFFKVAILSRGYRSRAERSGSNIEVNAALMSAEEVGDEPLWLARVLPEVPIWVGAERLTSALAAIAGGAKILILDDGMQHRQLERSIEIIVVDAKDLFGKGHFLPRGYLRDFPQRLKAADMIVVNHMQEMSEMPALLEQLSRYTSAPIVMTQMQLEQKPAKKVVLFCALGRPERFINCVAAETEIVDTLVLPDHEKPTLELLEQLALRGKTLGATAVVCSEKDAVKWAKLPLLSLPLVPLSAKLRVIAGQEAWHNLITKIKEKL